MPTVQVTPDIAIETGEIELHFIRASGPGGQNVNAVATAVQLRFDILGSPSLPADVRSRLVRLAGRRVTQDGVLVIDARRFRSQERNRQDAIDRLMGLIHRAAVPPRRRRRTRPTLGSKRARLDSKRRRANVKSRRRAPTSDSA